MKAVARGGISIALACRTFQISECCYRYVRKLCDENAGIAECPLSVMQGHHLPVNV